MNKLPEWLARQIAEAKSRAELISPERRAAIDAKYAPDRNRSSRHSHGHNFLFPVD